MGNIDESENNVSPLSDEAIKETKAKYPGLDYTVKDGIGRWMGDIVLNHIYKNYTINDSFKILIEVPKEYPEVMPKVKEIDNKTEKIAEKYKGKISGLIDLHVFPQEKNACLGAVNELRDKFPVGSPFYQYVENLVVPYFYGLSYFEKNGSWPWGERSHGFLGLFEAYGDRRIETSKEELIFLIKMLRKLNEWKDIAFYLNKIKKSRPCLCPKKEKPFDRCHAVAWEGIKRIQADIAKHKINIYQC